MKENASAEGPARASRGDGGAEYQRLLEEVESDAVANRVFQDTLKRTELLAEARRIREVQRKSQTTVADLMGTTQSAVSDLENGRVDAQLQTLQRYARALDRRFEFSFVAPSLPAPREGAASDLYDQVGTIALRPILTTLVKQPSEDRLRTVEALSAAIPLSPVWTEAILSGLQAQGWAIAAGDGDDRVYSLDPRAAFLIGVSVERDRVVGVLEDMNGRHLKSTRVDLADTSVDEVVSVVTDVVMQLFGGSDEQVIGIGVCLAGVVDPSGQVEFAPELASQPDSWRGVDLEELLQASIQTRLPDDHPRVFVENDANSLALAESLLGQGEGDEAVVTLLLSGTGTGAGVIIGSHLVRGAHAAAGEGGHFIVDPDGEDCRAQLDHRGCLETEASVKRILEGLAIPASTTHEIASGLAAANKLVSENDAAASYAFHNAGWKHGQFLESIILLLDPHMIVVYADAHISNSDYASAREFQSGVDGAIKKAASSRSHVADVPPIDWRPLVLNGIDMRARAAGMAALWHFLQRPHLQPKWHHIRPDRIPAHSVR